MQSTTFFTARLRSPIAALLLAMPAVFTLAALPATALAQPAAAEVRSFEVRSDGELGPGTRLNLRAVATPRGKATVRIQGIRERIALREVSPGVYTARYTLKRTDAVQDDREVRVALRLGNRTAAADYTLAEVMATRPPVATLPPPPPPPAMAQPALRIERFGVTPVERLEPGAELRFVLEGPPGATVLIDLPGVADDVALRELRPGHYEGGYTLRRADNIAPSRPIIATVRIGDRVATANLGTPLVLQAPVALPLQIVNHSNNGVVQSGSTMVQGRTAPFATVQAKVDGSAQVPGGFSVAQQLYAQTLQADANGNFSFSFTPRFPLPGSRYEVSLVSSKAGATSETRLTLFQR